MSGHRSWIILIVAVLCALEGGCAMPDRFSPTQLDALQVRVIDAGPDAVFSAACGAVMDSGYIVNVEDGRLRVLAATFRRDPSVAEHAGMMAATGLLSMGMVIVPAAPSYRSVAVQVLGAGPARSSVRIRTYRNGVPEHDADVVQELWVQIERRLLIPPSPGASSSNIGAR